METLTVQRRTIEIPKVEEKVNLKRTDKQRFPRKLKKKLKKRGRYGFYKAVACVKQGEFVEFEIKEIKFYNYGK